MLKPMIKSSNSRSVLATMPSAVKYWVLVITRLKVWRLVMNLGLGLRWVFRHIQAIHRHFGAKAKDSVILTSRAAPTATVNLILLHFRQPEESLCNSMPKETKADS